MDSIPRNDSLDNLVGNLWKIGRTPSEAEFQLLSGASLETESPMAAAGGNPLGAASLGMRRVASIDILRRMLLNQHNVLTQAQSAATATAAAEVLGAPAVPAGVVPVPAPAAAAAVPSGASGGAFSIPSSANLPDWGKVLAGSRATEGSAGTSSGGGRGQKRKESARVKSKAAAKKAKQPISEDESDSGEEEEPNFKNLSVEEQRRQRRMLSNRESARRSRRRKLEHVHIITAQLDVMRQESANIAKQLAESNARCDALARENVTLKTEVDKLNAQIRELAGGGGGIPRVGSMQRIPSSDHLVKRLRGEDSEVGESPRGFVPFRSLRSYENLLNLQQQGQASAIPTA